MSHPAWDPAWETPRGRALRMGIPTGHPAAKPSKPPVTQSPTKASPAMPSSTHLTAACRSALASVPKATWQKLSGATRARLSKPSQETLEILHLLSGSAAGPQSVSELQAAVAAQAQQLAVLGEGIKAAQAEADPRTDPVTGMASLDLRMGLLHTSREVENHGAVMTLGAIKSKAVR